MRLNKGKNIDKEVSLPPKLEFRAEKVWAKIDKRDSRRKILPWILGAITAACLMLFVWIPKTEEVQINDQILVTGLTKVPADLKLDLEGFKPVKQDEIQSKERRDVPEKIEVREAELPVLEKLEPPIVVAESTPDLPFEPMKNIKPEEKSSSKSLSPAALLLKKSLTNTKTDLVADQILIQEKFKLKNELAALGMEKSGNISMGTVFESLKKNNYAKN